MRKATTVAIVFSLIVPTVVLLYSEASSSCTVDQRIDLGKQGYTIEQVEKVCSSDAGVDKFFNQFLDGLGKGLADELSKALVGEGKSGDGKSPSPSASAATMCTTDYGSCPLTGVAVGYSCHCRAWNGYAYPGIAR